MAKSWRAAALIAATALGCGGVTGYSEPPPRPLNERLEAPRGSSLAAALVAGELSSLLDIAMPEPPAVLWYYLPLEYNDDRYCGGGGVLTGCFWGDEIHVALFGLRDRPSRSALSHEMIHWALEVATGDTDGEHVGPLWDEQDRLKDLLAAADL